MTRAADVTPGAEPTPTASTFAGLAGLAVRGSPAAPPRPPSAAQRRHLDLLVAGSTDPPWPDDLVARPCPEPAGVYHWRQLAARLEAPARSRADRVRIAFHARWLSSLLEPAGRHPRISVVIPVYNRPRLFVEALESALATDYPEVEILVVDDGSESAVAAAIAPYRGRLAYERQPNRGVSSARNRGIAKAGGDYLYFLDSDNTVDAPSFSRWIGALRCVADADICFSPARWIGRKGRPLPRYLQPPDGGEGCPTADLWRTVVRHHPFPMVGTLVARWRVLEEGGFDDRLRRGEDTRFWFRLGLRGVKAIGLRTVYNDRRELPTGLTRTRRVFAAHGRVGLLNALDTLESPRHWAQAVPVLRRVVNERCWWWVTTSDETLMAEARDRLLATIADLADGERTAGRSPRPLLVALRDAVLGCGSSTPDLIDHDFQRRVAGSVEASLRAAPASDASDLAFWFPERRHGSLSPETLLQLSRMASPVDPLGDHEPLPELWDQLDEALA
ncbi:MAG: glycosyltransferase family A protein, partial [Thermoanaerobaculia bacterium]|nr:glycosyltransferase family A protein [Thermoanaerobaculia bacterium]